MAWIATLLDKSFAVDGSVLMVVGYANGGVNIQKQYTFFGNYDLSQVVTNEIASFTAMQTNFQGTPKGPITPATASPGPTQAQIEQGQFFSALDRLTRYQKLVDIGVAPEDATYTNLKSSVVGGFKSSYI